MSPIQKPSRPLRLGILGCANIARLFARDVAPSPQVRLAAVASRDAGKAADFARTFGIGRHHGSYAALLEDDGIDAVYLPLPNTMHAEWAIRAASAGKHVLCEKPLAMDRAEARAMFDAARAHGVLLLEAYPYWFQPQTGDLLALLQERAIGEVRSVQASFGFPLPAAARDNIRLDPKLGGGALYDAGCYALSMIRLVMGCAPQRVQAEATWGDTGVDIALSATLSYADGRRARMACAMNTGLHRHALILGSTGVIETEYLNHTHDGPGAHPHAFLPSRMRLRRSSPPVLPFEEIRSATGSGFRFAAEAFARVVAERDTAAIDRAASASLDIAATLEAAARSARLERPVDLAAG